MRVLCALLAGLLLSSCSRPSYPKDQVGQAMADLCRSEYGIEVRARLEGTTLSVLASIPGLIDALRKSAASGDSQIHMPSILVEGRYAPEQIAFRVLARGKFVRIKRKEDSEKGRPKDPEEPIKKLRQVSTALLRVCLSTDAPVEFYQLIARDPGPEKLDVLFSGHLMDAKKTYFYVISQGEAQSRSEFSLRIQPEALAEQTVSHFLFDLRQQTLPKLLSLYTAPSRRFSELLPKFLAIAMELKGRERKLIGEDWPIRQIDRETLLVYVPLKPLGEPGAFLFTVLLRDNTGSFSEIEYLPKGELPERVRLLGPPQRWRESFFVHPLSLPEFIAEQIAKRVMSEFESVEEASELKSATSADVAGALAETAAYVIHSYDFKAAKKISIVDAVRGTRWEIPATNLPLYRRRNPPELKPIP